MSEKLLRRPLNPVVKVLDAQAGLVEYVASDESIDSFREIVRADGWRFTNFAKNAPFVDSHDYSSIDKLVGRVVDFAVKGRKLVETVQWAKDVAGNALAQLGWRMTEAGFLKAVSVGFYPVRYVAPYRLQDGDATFTGQAQDLGVNPDQVRAIYLEQEQVELSTVILGANPNALARAFKAGAIDDADLDFVATQISARAMRAANDGNSEPAPAASDPADAARARRRAEFLAQMNERINGL
jgi:hypothetical protein